ncbi:intersectin [Acrasis kona]|uniref:Intersectin n=1 Tax=Acrasis kona TaxID=1008807 RepID=A0AAW2ZMU9_9EUKA
MRAVVSLVLLSLLCVVFAGEPIIMSREIGTAINTQDIQSFFNIDSQPMFEAPSEPIPQLTTTSPPTTTKIPTVDRPTSTRLPLPSTLPPRLPLPTFNSLLPRPNLPTGTTPTSTRMPLLPTTTLPHLSTRLPRPTFLPNAPTRVPMPTFGGRWVQAFVDDKSPIQCPFGDIEKNKHVGGGNTRYQSNYFLSKNLKLAASCRLDCTSQVAGQLHFDGGCKQRFFYYANVDRCQVASELDDMQAKLAEAYCMRCNGCVKTHNRAFNAASAKRVVGDNSAKVPH